MSISTRFGARLLAALCFTFIAASPLSASSVRVAEPSAADSEIGVGEEQARAGAAALAEARAAKQAAYDLEAGEARSAALVAAAESYYRVSQTKGFELATRVEGAFRAGELLRTHGSAELAAERFAQCVLLGEAADPEAQPKVREFAARGLLEQAHLQRRGKLLEQAAASYAEVSRRFADVAERAAQARGWRLRMFLELDQLASAEAVGEELLEHLDDDPLESLRGVDRLGVALVEAGREQAARGLVERLNAGLAPHIEGDDSLAERLRGALQELRVTVRLSDS